MPVIDLSAYKPVPATLGDANQIANGMQAIQNVVNGLDQNNFAAGKIFDPAKLMQNAAIDGDPLVWDNTLAKWVPASTLAAGRPRALRVVTSTWAGGPPASPVTGDIWIATAVDATGTSWQFQYDSTQATYKWIFVGGPIVNVLDTSGFVVAADALFHSKAAFTAGRAGTYRLWGSWYGTNGAGGGGTYQLGYGINAVNQVTAGTCIVAVSSVATVPGIPYTLTVVVAGQALNFMYWSNVAGTGGVIGGAVVPVAII